MTARKIRLWLLPAAAIAVVFVLHALMATQAAASAALPLTVPLRWQDELVDKVGAVGAASSLALDSNGYAHIAYYDFTYHALKYAAWDGIAWTLDTVETGLGELRSAEDPLRSALAVYGGNAYIVYEKYDAATGRRYLRYAVGGPGGWNVSTLSTDSLSTYAYAPSLRRAPNGSLHVSFTLRNRLLQFSPQQIIYARLDLTSTNWLSQSVATSEDWDHGVVSSLALDANNRPHIAYGGVGFPNGPRLLNYLHWSGTSWLTQTVTNDGNLPSIAVDAAGNAHIAFLDSDINPLVKYAHWNGAAWQLENVLTCACSRGPSLALNTLDRPRIAIDNLYAQWNGTAWLSETLQLDASPVESSLALDGAGNPHISYADSDYNDLHHVSWAPDWQTRPVAASATDARLALDLRGRPFVSYNAPSANLLLANWTSGGAWQYRSVAPDAPYASLELQYDANRQPLPILSYQNDHLQNQEVARWNGTAFVTQTVDSHTYSGYYSSLALNGPNPTISYFDFGNGGVTYASFNISNWIVRPDTAQPANAAGERRSLSLGVAPLCCKSYIGYYHAISHTLRLATWDGTYWTDFVVDGSNGDNVGQYASLAVDRASGEPAIAYYDATHQAIKYAFRSGNTWSFRVVDAAVQGVTAVSLQLALNSNQYPRIAYTAQADNSLRLAWAVTTTEPMAWVTETVGTFATLPPQAIASRVQQRDHLAWSHFSAGVVYAFHSATLPYPVDYNPLQPCVEPQANPSTAGRALASLRAMSPADLPYADDLTTLRALRDTFALSTAGRRYIDLYYQHAPETGALAVANPSLLWDSYRTLQNFLPGFKSLAVGSGDDIVISQGMVDEVNDIADRLVAAGSPALGSAINTERAKYNHLQDFAGKTFKQASDILGTSVRRVYLPLTRR